MDFSQQFISVQKSVIRVIGLNPIDNSPISTGTGVLIGDGTKVITCSHCIVPGAITGCFHSNSDRGENTNVLFNDPIADIAILELQNSMGDGVTLGNSDEVKIGNEAFIVGYPMYSNEVTALFAHIAGKESYNNSELIKVDSSVNHGNSGGPLFNSNGELIGIVNSKFGNLSEFLNQIERTNPQAHMIIGGINPVQVIQQLISEMKKNLNLGVGTAIPINQVLDLVSHIIN